MRLIFQACSVIITLGNLVASQSQSSGIYYKSADFIQERLAFTFNKHWIEHSPAGLPKSKSWFGAGTVHLVRVLAKPGLAGYIQDETLRYPLFVLSCWKDAINTTIINFNNEKMRITWATRELFHNENVSFSYTFDEGKHKVWKPCPIYLLDHNYNTGCLFKTEGPTLAISIRSSNGSEEFFSKKLKADFYMKTNHLCGSNHDIVFRPPEKSDGQIQLCTVKPNPPENVTFFWKEDTVTVSCNKPERAVKCLNLELQYKSTFDKEWQSRTSRCCHVGDQGFDSRKCYSFRVRLKRLAPHCNVVDYSSDWEAETFWMNGTLLDSCDDDRTSQSNTVTVLSSLLAMLLMMLVLLILLCKQQRVQMSVMPAIPDPKYIFADLLNDHNGNFQEWLDKTDHVVLQTKLEYEEPECITEAESQQEDEKNNDKQGPLEKIFASSGTAENSDPKTAQIACLIPAPNTITSFAGFHILMNDDMYVTL